MEHLAENQKFVETYDDYADAIFRHCYYRIYDRELARDLMQEAFLRAWEYLAKGKKVLNLRAFIYKIANNLCIDHIRRKKESSLDSLMEAGFDPSGDDAVKIERSTDAGMAVSALQKLEDPYREAMVLRYVDDLTVKEIAEITGETENTISVRIHRATAVLKENFN